MKLPLEFRLLLLLAAAFLAGLLVLVINPDYRVEKNIASNAKYYPESLAYTPVPGEADEINTGIDF